MPVQGEPLASTRLALADTLHLSDVYTIGTCLYKCMLHVTSTIYQLMFSRIECLAHMGVPSQPTYYSLADLRVQDPYGVEKMWQAGPAGCAPFWPPTDSMRGSMAMPW